jgi:hypothetical protein
MLILRVGLYTRPTWVFFGVGWVPNLEVRIFSSAFKLVKTKSKLSVTLESSLKPKLGSQISKNWRQIATKFSKKIKIGN